MINGLDSHFWWVVKMIFAVTTGCLTIFGAVIGFLLVDRGESDTKIWFSRIWTKIDGSPFFILPEICLGCLVSFKRNLISSPLKKIINNRIFSGLFFTELAILGFLIWSQDIFQINNPFFTSSKAILFTASDWTSGILDNFLPSLSHRWKLGILLAILAISKKATEAASPKGNAFFIFVLNFPLLLLFYLPAFLFYLYLFLAALYIVFFSTNIWLSILFISILSVLLLSAEEEDNKHVRSTFLMFTTINLTYLSFLLGHVFSVDPNDYQPKTFQALTVNTFCDFLTVYFISKIFERLNDINNKTFYLPLYVAICILVSALLCVISLYFSLFKTDYAITIKECLYVFIGYSEELGRINLGSLFWFMHSSFIPVTLYILIVLIAWVAKINLLPLRWFLGRAAINEQPLKLTGAFVGIFIAVFGLFTLISNEFFSRAKDIEATNRREKTS